MFDITAAADRMAGIIAGIGDDQLDGPTPCPDYCVGDLADHVNGLSLAFTSAATRQPLDGAVGPSGDRSRLAPGWRDEIAGRLQALGEAWKAPGAWEGITQAGPIELPAEVAAVVTLNELLLHGWDLARSTGQAYEPSADELAISKAMLAESAAESPDGVEGLFGPPVVVDDPSLLDEVVGLAGRDPNWSPA